jgi:hypothetical protein
VLLAVALDTHGPKRITTPFAITLDDILTICQKKKSKGSYLIRQRLHVIKQVQALAKISVNVMLVLRDGKQWQIESPFVEEKGRAKMERKSLNIAIVGCGNIARTYGKTLQPYSQLRLLGATDHVLKLAEDYFSGTWPDMSTKHEPLPYVKEPYTSKEKDDFHGGVEWSRGVLDMADAMRENRPQRITGA